jgi:hypothetical protein
MGRPLTGNARLVPSTVKIDPELKKMIRKLSAPELRSPSQAGSILLQYGVMKWVELGNLQRIIDEINQGWSRTVSVVGDSGRARGKGRPD